MGNMQNILQNGELAAGNMHKKRNMHQAAGDEKSGDITL
jgi:hypothetical protein